MKEKIKSLSDKYFSEVVALRRHLHANPELSFVGYNTSAFVCSKLDEWGIPYKNGIVKTGIVALIEGRNPAKKIIAKSKPIIGSGGAINLIGYEHPTLARVGRSGSAG